MPRLNRENLMLAYQTAVGAGEAPQYLIVGTVNDEIIAQEVLAGLHLDLKVAYSTELAPHEWRLV